MDKYTELCEKYKTPKALVSFNPLSHDYAPHYNRLFEGRKIKKVVEIGCGYNCLFHRDYVSGGSLFVWSELFPGAYVFGLDIRSDALVNQGKITSYLCDQSDEVQLRNVAACIGGDIDLVIDDGSHAWQDQVLAAKVFVPLLSPNGVFVIEDVVPGRMASKHLPYVHEEIQCSNTQLGDDALIVILSGAEAKDVERD